MGLFTKTDVVKERLITEIEKLSKQLAETQGELDAKKLEQANERLMRENRELKEDHDRQMREIDHKVGLRKQQADFEAEKAKEEAIMAVKQENMKHKEDRFEEEMNFMRSRMEDEVASMRHMYDMLMERMPTVHVDRRIREEIKHNALEAGSSEDAKANESSKESE